MKNKNILIIILSMIVVLLLGISIFATIEIGQSDIFNNINVNTKALNTSL